MAREKAGFTITCDWCGSIEVYTKLSESEDAITFEMKCAGEDCQETTHFVKSK